MANDKPKFKLSRKSAAVVLLLTLVYLCLELPFSAHLLDIVGTTSDQDLVHQTEVVGRLISGFAAALLIWGVLIIPAGRKWQWQTDKTVVLCLIAAVPIITAVYWAEGQVVDHYVESSTAVEKQQALAILLFTQELQNGRASIKGLPLTSKQLHQPDGKTFMAMLPFMVNAISDIRKRLKPSIDEFVTNRVKERIGGWHKMWNDAYETPLHQLRDMHKQYRSAVGDYYAAWNKISTKADDKYAEYSRRLFRLYRGDPSRYACPGIRRKMRSEGVPVPDSWDCKNRRVFVQSIIDSGRAQAKRRFRAATKRVVGEPLSDELTDFDRFVADPAIQEIWHEKSGIPDDIPLRRGYSHEAFRKNVYSRIVNTEADKVIERYNAKTAAFEKGGEYLDVGQDAMRALLVPPIALMFSLLGAFTHIIKSVVTLLVVIIPGIRLFFKGAIIGTATAAVLIAPLYLSNSVTAAPVYQHVEQVAQEEMNRFGGYLVRWVMRAEPWLYPVSDQVRMWVSPVFDPGDNFVTRAVGTAGTVA